MPGRNSSLARDLSHTHLVEHESQLLDFSACDTDDNPPIFIGVEAGERNGAFSVDEAGDVCRNLRQKLFGIPSLGHDESYAA